MHSISQCLLRTTCNRERASASPLNRPLRPDAHEDPTAGPSYTARSADVRPAGSGGPIGGGHRRCHWCAKPVGERFTQRGRGRVGGLVEGCGPGDVSVRADQERVGWSMVGCLQRHRLREQREGDCPDRAALPALVVVHLHRRPEPADVRIRVPTTRLRMFTAEKVSSWMLQVRAMHRTVWRGELGAQHTRPGKANEVNQA